jgi:hypothetical protein
VGTGLGEGVGLGEGTGLGLGLGSGVVTVGLAYTVVGTTGPGSLPMPMDSSMLW